MATLKAFLMLRLHVCEEITPCSPAWKPPGMVQLVSGQPNPLITKTDGCIQTACKDPGSCQPPPWPDMVRVAQTSLCQGPADRELVFRPRFWLRFALCCRLKPQMLHGEARSRLKGGGVSGRVPQGRLPAPPRSALQDAARHLLAQLA